MGRAEMGMGLVDLVCLGLQWLQGECASSFVLGWGLVVRESIGWKH